MYFEYTCTYHWGVSCVYICIRKPQNCLLGMFIWMHHMTCVEFADSSTIFCSCLNEGLWPSESSLICGIQVIALRVLIRNACKCINLQEQVIYLSLYTPLCREELHLVRQECDPLICFRCFSRGQTILVGMTTNPTILYIIINNMVIADLHICISAIKHTYFEKAQLCGLFLSNYQIHLQCYICVMYSTI